MPTGWLGSRFEAAVKLTDTGEDSVRETAHYIGVLGITCYGTALRPILRSKPRPPRSARLPYKIEALENSHLPRERAHAYLVSAPGVRDGSGIRREPRWP